MENKTKVSSSLDHLFGPKDPSPSTSGILGSLFPPPVKGNQNAGNIGKCGNPDNYTNGSQETSSFYQNETVEPSYLSSSIYYGGQENYSPTTRNRNNDSHHFFKNEVGKDDPDGNSNGVSRGNWWQGSLYY